jgi:glycosyltransferase involved in cell wall biosynthesis
MTTPGTRLINVTLPVFNEAARLPDGFARVRQFLAEHSRLAVEVVIVDNASTDGTLDIARQLSREWEGTRVVRLDKKGRGGALKHVWLESRADVLSYMDIDLSTDLAAFGPLVEALISGRFDLAVGSRLRPESATARCWQREAISHCYISLVKMVFRTRFSDAQCGFKAITREAAARLLPAVEDTGWFFDTELLVLAEKCGYRIFDLPVRWTEDPDSRVKILRTAWGDLRGILRLYRKLRRGEYARLTFNPALTK